MAAAAAGRVARLHFGCTHAHVLLYCLCAAGRLWATSWSTDVPVHTCFLVDLTVQSDLDCVPSNLMADSTDTNNCWAYIIDGGYAKGRHVSD